MLFNLAHIFQTLITFFNMFYILAPIKDPAAVAADVQATIEKTVSFTNKEGISPLSFSSKYLNVICFCANNWCIIYS